MPRKAPLPALVLAAGIFFLLSRPGAAAEDSSVEQGKRDIITEVERFRKESAEEPEKTAPPPQIAAREEAAREKEAEGPRFLLKKVEFEGHTLFPAKDFEKYARPYENRTVSFEDLKAVAQGVTNHYRVRGYTLSRAYLAPQKIEDGVVKITIVEGKIREITVEGNKFFSPEIYKRAFRLDQDRIFRYQDFERNLLRLNRRPDRSARAYLAPSEEAGLFDITLKAEDFFPFHIYYDFNNRGTKLTHRGRHTVSAYHHNFLGWGDTANFNLTLSEEDALGGMAFGWSRVIESAGTTFSADVGYAEVLIVKHLKKFEIKGESLSFVPEATQILFEDSRGKLEVKAGLEAKDSETLVDGARTEKERVRLLRVGPAAAFNDASGRTLLSYDIRYEPGGFLGAGETEFAYQTLSASRIQRLPHSLWLVVIGEGQWTDDSLPSLEDYRLGGARSVRGYPEADAVGDQGWRLSSELGAPSFFLPESFKVPGFGRSWRESLRWIGFLEGGKSILRQRVEDATVKDKFLLGIGLGLRFEPGENLSFKIDLGFPIGDRSGDENQMQTHVSFHAGF